MFFNNISPVQALTLGGPAVTLVLAASFFVLARINQRAVYLRSVGLSFVLASLGAIGQILRVPADINLNAVITGALYVGCVLALVNGLIQRLDKKLDSYTTISAFVLIVGGLWYYSYIEYDLRLRIYILNVGCSLVLLRALIGLGPLFGSKGTDKWLYWATFILALSILLRTSLTLSPEIGATTAGEFGWSRFWIVLQISMALSAVILAVVLIISAMSDQIHDLDQASNHDALTGLLNRRGLDVYLRFNTRRAHDQQLSIVVMDSDRFKLVNDQFGHSVGDAVLVKLAQLLEAGLRRQDAAVRVGGEEFIALLPGTDNTSAAAFAERLRGQIKTTQFEGVPMSHPITASFGVATRRDGESFPELFDRADAMLYKAKNHGRNQVVHEHSPAAVPA